MSDRQETTDDIIREMRDLGALDAQCNDMIPRSLQALGLRTYAARLEAATVRERNRQHEPKCNWSIRDALALANTLANHGLRDGNADAASSCIYSLCRILSSPGNAAAMRLCDELIQAAYDADICSPGDLAQRVRKIKDAIGPSPQGDVAAMRAALESMSENLAMHVRCGRFVAPGDHVAFPISEAEAYIRDIQAALDEPARNCDRFTDEMDAQLAFLNEVWLISVTREMMLERDRFDNGTCEMRSEFARWLLATADGGTK